MSRHLCEISAQEQAPISSQPISSVKRSSATTTNSIPPVNRIMMPISRPSPRACSCCVAWRTTASAMAGTMRATAAEIGVREAVSRSASDQIKYAVHSCVTAANAKTKVPPSTATANPPSQPRDRSPIAAMIAPDKIGRRGSSQSVILSASRALQSHPLGVCDRRQQPEQSRLPARLPSPP